MPVDRLQTWNDFENHQMTYEKQREKYNAECIHCPTCNSMYFEQVHCAKFDANHNIIVGQEVPMKQDVPYYVLRCVNCNLTLEPNVSQYSRDPVNDDYDKFLDTLEGKLDKREDKHQSYQNNAIESQEL